MPRSKHEAIDRLIGKNIRHYRLLRGWSLAALGQAVGVTFQQIQKYEGGINRVAASTLFRIAHVLSIDLNQFFDNRGNAR